MHAKALLLLGSLLSGLTWTEHVLAFEDVWHAGGGLGAVNASASDVGLGIGANAYAAYGLSDMFDLKLDLAASSHAVEVVSGASERYRVLTATLGAAYKIDIIEWIPYFGVHAGYMTSDLPEWIDMEAHGFLIGGMIGLDYAVTRSFGVGIVNRLHWPIEGSSLVDLFIRAEHRWGW